MTSKIERIEEKLSAAEVDKYFLVPEGQQRDWRRKLPNSEILGKAEKGKRFLFPLEHACALAIAKEQMTTGREIAFAIWSADAVMKDLVQNIEQFDQAIAVDGIKPESTGCDRYVFLPNHTSPFTPDKKSFGVDKRFGVFRAQTLAELERKLTDDWAHGQLFDLRAMARVIVDRLEGRKLVTYRRAD